jgi:predicted O-linked N-acetylglucosamine transferase (SPINDLY family)
MQTVQLMQNAFHLHRAGKLAEAAQLYGEVLRVQPQHFDALFLLGTAYSQAGRLEDAARVLGEAVRVNPGSPDALYRHAFVLHRLDRFEDAIVAYEALLARTPANANVLNNLGAARSSLGQHHEALRVFDEALSLQPGYVDALNNRGNALLYLQRYEEALSSYSQALAQKPDHIDALCNRGTTLMQLRRFEDAIADFRAALRLDPNRMDAVEQRGRALSELHLYAEALPDLERALAAQPERPDLLYNRGNAYSVLKRYEEAVRDCEAALAIDPTYPFARGVVVHARLHCCDWIGLDRHRAQVSADLAAGRRALSPFEHILVSGDAAEQLRCAKLWVEKTCPPAEAPLWRGERYRHDRIRVAYLSADFRNHPVAAHMAGVFEAHDRSRFETIALSFTPEHQSPLRTRLEAAFDRFEDVRGASDLEIARKMRALEIDIAIDLMGFTRECRAGIFAHRPAPIQLNFLGYPGTMGAPYYDYIVADEVVIPEEHKRYFSEKVTWLPGAFFPNDGKRARPQGAASRRDLGLPEDAFVFCSFNGVQKITPEIFALWMRVLAQVEGSVLWLPKPSAVAESNLRKEAAAAGVAPERIVFAGFVPEDRDHLARIAAADLFLDTSPYGAHSTACDALFAGLPVLTCPGETFASRVVASLVTAAGFPELVAASREDYEAKAVGWARDRAALARLRARLGDDERANALFDSTRFCRKLEASFLAMWDRHRKGMPPGDVTLPPDASSEG